MRIIDDVDVLRRAHGDWSRKSGHSFKTCKASHVKLDWSGFEYVALYDEHRLLVVYRVQLNRRLKRLKQWPWELRDLLSAAVVGCTSASCEGTGPTGSGSSTDPETVSVASVRDDPQILGFRLELMRFRGIAAQAGNEEWVGRLDRAIDVLKNL